jgi:predicted O-linked N-acetylglucosamine transferase (SPINDLY family)
MNLAQIIEALPLQVYVRRGEHVIHFSTPSDLINRLAARMRRSPLVNARQYAGDVETVFRRMWRHWCKAGRVTVR